MKISERCYAVTGLAYSPPWSVNAGFVTGRDATLIVDSGANGAAAATIHGYALAARPSNTLRVINTEKHFDHIGGNRYFRQLGAEIWGHSRIARTEKEFAAEVEEFNAQIPNAVRRARGEAQAFFHNTAVANPTHGIDADTRMDLGDCPVEILLTPGHTPTNLSVWVPRDGVLYCGDCLTNLYLPNLDASAPSEWPGWLDSIDRIRRCKPHAVMCGHGPVAVDEEVLRLCDRVSSVIERAIRDGGSPTA